MKFYQVFAVIAIAAALSVGGAQASPLFETFGPLPQATFGGSGIPNDDVAQLDDDFAGIGFILGLTAHQRFDNPPLTNDGAGTFFAGAGSNVKGGPPTEGALWNFAFYAEIKGGPSADGLGPGGDFDDVGLELLYDVDPGAGTDFGTVDVIGAALFSGAGAATVMQDSQNLLFDILAGIPALPFISPPAGSFDPNAPGIYSFVLRVTDQGSVLLATSIDVVVGAPEPAALGLVGAALLGLGLLRRRLS